MGADYVSWNKEDIYFDYIKQASPGREMDGAKLTSSARMCLFFWLKNFEGSERVLKVNFMYSQSNLGPQIPVFFPAPVSFAWVTFLFFFGFFWFFSGWVSWL